MSPPCDRACEAERLAPRRHLEHAIVGQGEELGQRRAARRAPRGSAAAQPGGRLAAAEGVNSISAQHRPGRRSAGCRRPMGSLVVTSSRQRCPCPSSPSARFRIRERPWPTSARADALINSPASSSTIRRHAGLPSSCADVATRIRKFVPERNASGSVTWCRAHQRRHDRARARRACVLPVPGAPCQSRTEPRPGHRARSREASARRTSAG
jgi:hypothetical protein